MNKDTMHEVANFKGLDAVTFAGDATEVGEIIDTQGYESLTFLLMTGAGVTGSLTPLIESSSSSTFAGDVNTVDAGSILGSVAGATFTGAGASDKTSKIGVVNLAPTQRYVRLSIVGTDTAGGEISAQALKACGRSDDTYTTQKPMG